MPKKPTHFTCCDCRESIALLDHGPNGSGAAGYGIDQQGRKFCYPCCADKERARMIESGRASLYLVKDDSGAGRISDWAGELRFNVKEGPYRGNHNIAGKRWDAWFHGPDGHIWHGVNYGYNSQIIRCRRTKQKAAA